MKRRVGRRQLFSGESAVSPASALVEGKRPVALAMRFLFVLQGDRSYYDMRLANNLHVREDKAATARKRGGKPKPHREFRRDYFRGGNAPASLKLHSLRPAQSSCAEFPGWKRPGLIEAVLGQKSVTPRSPHFRGGNAPASLKRLCRTCSVSKRCYFRGGNAPASLKLGLSAWQRLFVYSISGVETPRPH